MLTRWDLDEAASTVAALLDAAGEPVIWRRYEGMGGDPYGPIYAETEIRARFAPISLGLVSAGLYMKTDLQVLATVPLAPGDRIARFGILYQVLDEPFARRISDCVVAYETKARRI